MPISDLCAKGVVCIERGASLQAAAKLMKKHHLGGLIVVEGKGATRPVGVLTDRDIVLGIVAENKPSTTTVEEVMSKNVVKVRRSEGIASVVDQMEQEGVRRMVIVDDAGEACGLVSADDIIQLVARELNGLGRLVGQQVENERSPKAWQSPRVNQ